MLPSGLKTDERRL